MLVRKPKTMQSIPAVFKAIIQNDVQRRITKEQCVVNFAEHKRLHVERQDLTKAAVLITARKQQNT